jgi:uroporphyrinogen-III synthase
MRPIYLFSISSHPNAISVNSLCINFLQSSFELQNYDFCIVTSKQVSEYFKKFHITPSLPALCVSTKSAEAYEMIGGEVLEVGGGYGDNLQKLIKNYPKEKKWLYLRAKIVASNFVEQVKNDGYNVDEVIIYESSCSQDILDVEIAQQAILIFTSPSSVECYLKKHLFRDRDDVIVIGKTTAKKLPNYVKYKQSKETTIQSCIDLAYSMEENRDIFV